MPKGKNKNLMPIEQVNSNRSREQHSEDSRKGGIASAEARRAKKSLANIAKEIAQQPAPEKLKGQIKRSGLAITDEDMTCNAAIVAGVYGKAVSGDDRAVERWETWTNESTAEDKLMRYFECVVG